MTDVTGQQRRILDLPEEGLPEQILTHHVGPHVFEHALPHVVERPQSLIPIPELKVSEVTDSVELLQARVALVMLEDHPRDLSPSKHFPFSLGVLLLERDFDVEFVAR